MMDKMPIAEFTETGFAITWRAGAITLTLEILTAGGFDWFFYNRDTNVTDGCEEASSFPPVGFTDRFIELCAANEAYKNDFDLKVKIEPDGTVSFDKKKLMSMSLADCFNYLKRKP